MKKNNQVEKLDQFFKKIKDNPNISQFQSVGITVLINKIFRIHDVFMIKKPISSTYIVFYDDKERMIGSIQKSDITELKIEGQIYRKD
ncbi:MAG: hypothetical protein FWH54_00185 [Methanobrevibacter sp.]|nr:hypothetical protein [Methanobrevibacter sp.]